MNRLNPLSSPDNTFHLLSKPLPFSHWRYFGIRLRQVLLRYRTNSPFLSCDSFARLADYVVFGISGNKKIKKAKLRKAKVLFVKSHQLEKLILDYGKSINAKVILTGNSDFNFTVPVSLPESVQVVFAQNCGIASGGKFRPLPIGLENLRGGRSGLKRLHKDNHAHTVTDKIYLPPMAPTNPIRFDVVEKASLNREIFEVDRQYKNEEDYFRNVKKYKFVFCCEGNGFETHRIWESFYQNSFPVMLETSFSKGLASLELPILLVKDLGEINPNLLKNFLEKNSSFDSRLEPKLWINYWKTQVNSFL